MDEPVQEVPVKRSRLALLTLIAVILAAGLAALFWVDARQRIGGTQEELARRLRDIEGDVREARSTARQSQELLREAQAKIGQLESRLAGAQSQQLALEALYQELSRNRDEWQLPEIEQVLAIAPQQLPLAGNIPAPLPPPPPPHARPARADPPLLPPTQAYFLRENLRLRLLNARLSLLMRDEAGYREDMRAAQAWVRRYFDTRSKQTADALAQLKTLSSALLSFEMPSISESLEAVRGFKSRRERAPG